MMTRRASVFIVIAIASLFVSQSSANASTIYHRILPIVPIAQRTPQSCWLAVAEMVLRYFGVPVDHVEVARARRVDPQCTIFLVTVNPANQECEPSGESIDKVRAVMTRYPVALQQENPSVYTDLELITTNAPTAALSEDAIMREIDAGRPIAAVLSIRASEHIVLIVGYDRHDTYSGINVTINDPFPYQAMSNPWLDIASSSVMQMQYSVPLAKLPQVAQWSAALTGFATSNLPNKFSNLNVLHPDTDADETIFRPSGRMDGQISRDFLQLISVLQTLSLGSLKNTTLFRADRCHVSSFANTPDSYLCVFELQGKSIMQRFIEVANQFGASLPPGFRLVQDHVSTAVWVSGYNIEVQAVPADDGDSFVAISARVVY